MRPVVKNLTAGEIRQFNQQMRELRGKCCHCRRPSTHVPVSSISINVGRRRSMIDVCLICLIGPDVIENNPLLAAHYGSAEEIDARIAEIVVHPARHITVASVAGELDLSPSKRAVVGEDLERGTGPVKMSEIVKTSGLSKKSMVRMLRDLGVSPTRDQDGDAIVSRPEAKRILDAVDALDRPLSSGEVDETVEDGQDA